MSYELPELNYEYNALEPYIDAQTMEIHHSKHHAGYVNKLNTALEGHSDLLEKDVDTLLLEIDQVPQDIRQNVINNAGGHANHSLFWEILSPEPKLKPDGPLLDAIEHDFGGFEELKEAFAQKASSVFGSGWAFLIKDKTGKLSVKRHSFQNSPLLQGSTPLMGLDVWEHAYYLKYQNRRDDYIEAFWNVLDWGKVSEIFEAAE